MKRHSRSEADDVTPHLRPLFDDDRFLTELSRGVDPSEGSDPLAAALLELRADVDEPMPAAPEFDLPPAPASRRGPGPLAAGLMGAAAATVIVAGSGAALYNAQPGSALWGPSSQVFGERGNVVELASTLDELKIASESGDREASRSLLEQARDLVQSMGSPARPEAQADSVTVTHTVTAPAPQPAPAEPAEPSAPAPSSPAPTETVTQTLTVTATVTATPAARPSEPTSAQASEPTTAPAAGESGTPSSSAAPGTAE
ncbi:hypothetical protein [Corynebacterium liangguodongii]|uniref:Uncharacterized protein n=1 Tax=Corynebacterium liangguodongii TaxID=2079535 RepID=A0A2S0WCD9_9CORY|nr:hypothetical protein [Corynebacterium liangguodongii]AWB83428.1 hypothetical protein C3E79_02085 [Corynebacterium liangguodongii]PWC00482.1 hypothetical protein DF219_00865 [Corynebacterium liangguodongii]